MNKNNILILLLFTGISYFFNAELNKAKKDIETLMEKKVSTKMDSRFKFYDFEFLFDHIQIKEAHPCLNIDRDIVLQYYNRYSAEITPFGKKLLKGEYKCSLK